MLKQLFERHPVRLVQNYFDFWNQLIIVPAPMGPSGPQRNLKTNINLSRQKTSVGQAWRTNSGRPPEALRSPRPVISLL